MKLKTIVDLLNTYAPPAFQESYDNSGLSIGDAECEVTGILITLDITPDVLKEAEAKHCNLVISHHPLIFRPVKSLTGKTVQEQIIIQAIRSNLCIFSLHTNLDSIAGGVNTVLADQIGLANQKILRPRKGLLKKLVTFCPDSHAEQVRQAIFSAGAGMIGNYDSCSFNASGTGTFKPNVNARPFVGETAKLHFEPEIRIETIFPGHLENAIKSALIESHPYEEVAYDIYPIENEFPLAGSGVIGELKRESSFGNFLQLIKEKLNLSHVRYVEGKSKKINKVAVCGGSGTFLIADALAARCDAFITADIKYHDFQDAAGQLHLIDAGHFETEILSRDLIKNILSEKFPKFAVHTSMVNTNPIKFM